MDYKIRISITVTTFILIARLFINQERPKTIFLHIQQPKKPQGLLLIFEENRQATRRNSLLQVLLLKTVQRDYVEPVHRCSDNLVTSPSTSSYVLTVSSIETVPIIRCSSRRE